MLSGRHLILLGILACAGLLSVNSSQRQIDYCYKIAGIERELREIRADIDLSKIKHRALQSPKSVMNRAAELSLQVAPVPERQISTLPPDLRQPVVTGHSLGTPQGSRNVQHQQKH